MRFKFTTVEIRPLITSILLGTALLGISQPRLADTSDMPNVLIIYGDDVPTRHHG
jgi:hypothetical protein